MDEDDQVNWGALAQKYLDRNPKTCGPIRKVLENLRTIGPLELTSAVDMDAANTIKPESTSCLLYMIEHALEDHALTDEEIRTLTILRRVFRIDEGDLVHHHPDLVTRLLCREAELIFEDQAINQFEAVHKTRLQEVFGLSYDDFISILEPEIDRLMGRLLERLDGQPETWLGTDLSEVRDRLAAISLVRHYRGLRAAGNTRAGYIYLLVNPSMPGMVKVGRTTRPPGQRAAELTAATGVPTPFTVVFDLFVPDQFAAEAYVHDRLTERGARISGNREFFAIAPREAVQIMMEVKNKI